MNQIQTSSIFLLCLLSFLPSYLSAQTRRITCSHENMQRLEKLHPDMTKKRDSIEQVINSIYNQNYELKDITIPVIFHVLYSNEEERVSEAEISAQLQATNLHFADPLTTSKHKSIISEKFNERTSTLNIKLCTPLSETLPIRTSAINFHQLTPGLADLAIENAVKEWTMDDAIKSSRRNGVEPVDPEHFLNIWIANLEDGLAGYAQMPGGPLETDGIVIDMDFFGTQRTANTPYNLGGTLTHLIGNYLGLHSLWGETRCADDHVFDTPIHNARNFGKPAHSHFSTCTGEVEMHMNFMDSTDDCELQFFTLGQKYRAHAFLSPGGPRAGLLESTTDCAPNRLVERSTTTDNTPFELTKTDQVKVFPNPVGQHFNITYELIEALPTKLIISQINGQIMYTVDLPATTNGMLEVNAAGWNNGVYILNVQQAGKAVNTQKIIINTQN